MQTVIGTGTDYQLYICGTLDQSWMPAPRLSGSLGPEARAVFPDGKILGFQNANLWPRASLDGYWVVAPKGSVPILDVAIYPDGEHPWPRFFRSAPYSRYLGDDWSEASNFPIPKVHWSDNALQVLAVATFPYSNPEKTGLHLINTDKAKGRI